LFYDTVSADNIPLQKYIVWSKTLHGDEAESAVVHVENLEIILPETETVHVSFSGRCAAMIDLETILIDELKETATVITTRYPRLDFTLIDILPPDASKGIGLEKLAKIENLAPENVMVCGDNFNDLHMLEFAGTPVVMGNADRSLLEREEFYKTVSNEENGVAAAIERFILNKEN
jgi:HAD superfamily hydrolase (TIGR01484 family)